MPLTLPILARGEQLAFSGSAQPTDTIMQAQGEQMRMDRESAPAALALDALALPSSVMATHHSSPRSEKSSRAICPTDRAHYDGRS